MWKRRLAKLNANNPGAIADSRWWFNPILPVSSRGVLAFFAFAAEPRPGHRFETSLRDRLLAFLAHSECTLLDPSECLLDCS